MKIISKRQRVDVVSFFRSFEDAACPGSGFSFDCDEQGVLKSRSRSYEMCLAGTIDGRRMIDRGIARREHSYVQPAVGKCDHCRAEVMLSGFTNPCDCGADYNMSGQGLAPREQWGEETGESLDEILAIA